MLPSHIVALTRLLKSHSKAAPIDLRLTQAFHQRSSPLPARDEADCSRSVELVSSFIISGLIEGTAKSGRWTGKLGENKQEGVEQEGRRRDETDGLRELEN